MRQEKLIEEHLMWRWLNDVSSDLAKIDAVVHCWHFVEILQCLFCNYLRNFDLGALAYLHKRRVLHRDVKPSHIFIGETGQADQLFRNHLLAFGFNHFCTTLVSVNLLPRMVIGIFNFAAKTD